MDDLLIDSLEPANDGLGSAMRPESGPSIAAWHAANGHFETYAYGTGPRGSDPVHVHEHVQICLSLNFPGRYRSGHKNPSATKAGGGDLALGAAPDR